MLANEAACTKYTCKILKSIHVFNDELCWKESHSLGNYAWLEF